MVTHAPRQVTTYSSRRFCDGAEDHTTNGFAGRESCPCDGSPDAEDS
jgi:hypothetical protein